MTRADLERLQSVYVLSQQNSPTVVVGSVNADISIVGKTKIGKLHRKTRVTAQAPATKGPPEPGPPRKPNPSASGCCQDPWRRQHR